MENAETTRLFPPLIILHLSNACEWSGAEVMLCTLIKADKVNRHIVLCPPGAFQNKIIAEGIRYRSCRWLSRVNRTGTSSNNIRIIKHVFRIILGNCILLYHTINTKANIVQTVHFSTFLYTLLIRFIPGCKILIWQHDIANSARYLDRFFIRTLINFADRIIAISKTVKTDLIKLGTRPEQITLIYNGIDVTRFNKSSPDQQLLHTRYSIDNNKSILAVIAAFESWKGQLLAIDALNLIAGDHNWHLLLIGGFLQDHSEYIRLCQDRIEQLKLGDRITITGKLTPIENYYPEIAIVLNTSTRPEPFGLTICEAMAAGCIVIGPDEGGPSEIILSPAYGFRYQPGNAKDLAKQIQNTLALTFDESTALTTRARERVDSHFNLSNFSFRFNQLYQGII